MARAALLVLLVVLALPLGVAGSPTDTNVPTAPPAPSLEDVAILTLAGDSRASFATASMDVATAMAIQRDAGAARLERYALEERFERTASTEARKRLLFEAATSVEIRITGLRDEERALRVAYVDRDIDAATFVRRLVLVHTRVGDLRLALDRVQSHADSVPQFSLRRRVRLLDASLFGLEGPVRERALAAMVGDAAPSRLYVAGSERGVVLSTVTDGRFVREAYRSDHRDTDTVGGMSLNQAADRTSELYPIAYNTSNSIRTGINGLSGGLYRIDIELRQGLITAYLDGATRNVFFEVQERRLDLLDPRPSVVGTANGTRLVVNRSYAGGPVQITVTDNATAEALPATVLVEGDRLETGPDGVAWTLSPPAPFEVTAVGPRGNVTVSARPFVPTAINATG